MEYYDLNIIGAAEAIPGPAGQHATSTDGVSPDTPLTGTDKEYLTADDVARIIQSALASLKVYVVESDITDAQNSVRAVVEHSKF